MFSRMMIWFEKNVTLWYLELQILIVTLIYIPWNGENAGRDWDLDSTVLINFHYAMNRNDMLACDLLVVGLPNSS